MEACYPRSDLRRDALYNFIRIREVYLSVSKKLMAVTRVQDAAAEKMVALGFAEPACLEAYKTRILQRFAHIDEFDACSPLDIYRCVRAIRKEVFGAAEDALWQAQAKAGIDFWPAIDQSHLKDRLIAENHTLTVVLTQAELTDLMEQDLKKCAGSTVRSTRRPASIGWPPHSIRRAPALATPTHSPLSSCRSRNVSGLPSGHWR